MSWYVQCAGKPGPALASEIEKQFDNARRGCANNPAEVAAINAQAALVVVGLQNLTSDKAAVAIFASGHYVPRSEYSGGATPEQFRCETKVETLLNWAD
ncbi:MAG: hypothetical protein JWM87_712 [Candidatus Eremiobacteraeota bacterium]|nr:hypothetical protein [Candidatus Eremiobacteraeota bacterium]